MHLRAVRQRPGSSLHSAIRADGAYESRTQSRRPPTITQPDRPVRTDPRVRAPSRLKGLLVQTRSFAAYEGTDAVAAVRLLVQERPSDPAPSQSCYRAWPHAFAAGCGDGSRSTQRTTGTRLSSASPAPFGIGMRRREWSRVSPLTQFVVAGGLRTGEAVHAAIHPSDGPEVAPGRAIERIYQRCKGCVACSSG